MSRAARAAMAAGYLLVLGYILSPFLWQVATSLRHSGDIASGAWRFSALTLENYREVFSGRHGFGRHLLNSAVIAGAAACLSVLLGSLAGYALSRRRFRWRGPVLALILAASLLPQIAAVSPLFLIFRKLGLLNTHAGLIIAYTGFGLPLAVWLLANFFGQLPPEMEEAAAVDGAGFRQTIRHVLAPLAAPGVFTAAILVFIFAWNEFVLALTLNTSHAMRTATVGIAMFPGQHQMPWGVIFAASTVVTVPLVLMVLALQRRIVSGLLSGAVKQ